MANYKNPGIIPIIIMASIAYALMAALCFYGNGIPQAIFSLVLSFACLIYAIVSIKKIKK